MNLENIVNIKEKIMKISLNDFLKIDKERLICLALSHVMNFNKMKELCEMKDDDQEKIFLDKIKGINFQSIIKLFKSVINLFGTIFNGENRERYLKAIGITYIKIYDFCEKSGDEFRLLALFLFLFLIWLLIKSFIKAGIKTSKQYIKEHIDYIL